MILHKLQPKHHFFYTRQELSKQNLMLIRDLTQVQPSPPLALRSYPRSPGSARTRASPPEAPSAHTTGERSGSLAVAEELEVCWYCWWYVLQEDCSYISRRSNLSSINRRFVFIAMFCIFFIHCHFYHTYITLNKCFQFFGFVSDRT